MAPAPTTPESGKKQGKKETQKTGYSKFTKLLLN